LAQEAGNEKKNAMVCAGKSENTGIKIGSLQQTSGEAAVTRKKVECQRNGYDVKAQNETRNVQKKTQAAKENKNERGEDCGRNH